MHELVWQRYAHHKHLSSLRFWRHHQQNLYKNLKSPRKRRKKWWKRKHPSRNRSQYLTCLKGQKFARAHLTGHISTRFARQNRQRVAGTRLSPTSWRWITSSITCARTASWPQIVIIWWWSATMAFARVNGWARCKCLIDRSSRPMLTSSTRKGDFSKSMCYFNVNASYEPLIRDDAVDHCDECKKDRKREILLRAPLESHSS